MLFILSLLLSQLSVDLLPELIHELSNSSFDFLVNEIGNTLTHVSWNLVKVVLLSFFLCWTNLLTLSSLMHWSGLNHWFSLISWLVARLDWWSSALILYFLAVIRHLVVNQDVLSDQWNVVVDKVVPVIMLLIVVHQLLSLGHVNQLWSICLSTSLVASIWLRVYTLE